MPNETIILDERLDASRKDVETSVSGFFAQYIALPLGIDIDVETNGDIQF
jgi:hypothetical protein